MPPYSLKMVNEHIYIIFKRSVSRGPSPEKSVAKDHGKVILAGVVLGSSHHGL